MFDVRVLNVFLDHKKKTNLKFQSKFFDIRYIDAYREMYESRKPGQ